MKTITESHKDKPENEYQKALQAFVDAARKRTQFFYNTGKLREKLLLGIPSLGRVRLEWAAARYGQVIPVNWTLSEIAVPYYDPSRIMESSMPVGFLVADAYNVIVDHAIEKDVEWLFTIEDDTMPPPDCFIKMREYVEEGKYPIVSGLYYTKSRPSEPQIYRGRGTGAFKNFKLGGKVWCDGIAMGCLLIHMSILKKMSKEAKSYKLPDGKVVKQIFRTPMNAWIDPETLAYRTKGGTQDLDFCDRLLENDKRILREAGWKEVADMKYPFLVDTSIFCKHIDLNTGVQYP